MQHTRESGTFVRRVVKSLVIAVLLTMTSVHSTSQSVKITAATMTGTSSILLRTNGSPLRTSSKLSADKKRVTITLENALIQTDQTQLNASSGLIESGFLQRSAKNAVLTVLLRQPAGYSVALLPYSRTLSIDVFDWSSVSQAEDLYRSGLLALQNDAVGIAADLFRAASSKQHPDATAHAGFISAREGDFNAAKDYFLKALDLKTSLSDVYAGLAQVFYQERNTMKARSYEQEFVKQTGQYPHFDSVKLSIQKTQPLLAEPTSLVWSVSNNDTLSETSTLSSNASTSSDANTDSVMKELRSLQGNQGVSRSDSTVSTASAQDTSLLGSWLSSALIGGGIALLFIGLIFIRSYATWRKKQLQHITSPPLVPSIRHVFDSKLQQAMAVSEQAAANLYKRSGSLIDRTDETPSAPSARPTNIGETKHAATQEHQEPAGELFDFDERVYQERDRRPRVRTAEEERATRQPLRSADVESPVFNTRARAQLSAEEMASVPPPEVESRPGTVSLDVDTESLEQLAKQLGIDPALLASIKKKNKSVQE